jgi:chromosome partitioning protein
VGEVLAVANQKGGVAKTTTVHSLGVASAEFGRRVLVIDLDPQACLTYSLGFDPDRLERSLHDVFVRREPVADVARPVQGVPGLDLLPATIDLAGSEVHLLTRTGREHVLERALEPVLDRYDLVLVDCPPSLGVLTINGLTAADAVLIPLQCEALSHRGVGQLLETIEDVRAFANSSIRVRGIVVTMYDDRTRHSRHIMDEVGSRYGLPVLQPPGRKSIRFAEAPARGKSIIQHAPTSQGALAYRELARTLLETGVPAGTFR